MTEKGLLTECKNTGVHDIRVIAAGESAVVVVRPGETVMIAENPLRFVPRKSEASDYEGSGNPPLNMADIPRAAL